MRETKKTQREEEALEMARSKEAREATSAEIIDALRTQQTETERLKPGSDKDAARAKYIQGIAQLVREGVLLPEEAKPLLASYFPTTSSAGGGSQSGGSLATGDPRKLKSS